MLSDIHIDERCGGFVDGLKQINEHRISIHQEMIQIATQFLNGPKPGVEYGNLLARTPQLTAENDSLDELLFKIASAVFLCLVDDTRTNAKGNLEYLILTRSERDQMRNRIRSIFGANLDTKDQKYVVSAGWVMNQGLSMTKYKAVDEISRMGAGPPTPR
jgi:hypothetical protein